MEDTDKQVDENKGDDVLKRMLKTPPDPKSKDHENNPKKMVKKASQPQTK